MPDTISEIELLKLRYNRERSEKLEAQIQVIQMQQIMLKKANTELMESLYEKYRLPKSAKIDLNTGAIERDVTDKTQSAAQ